MKWIQPAAAAISAAADLLVIIRVPGKKDGRLHPAEAAGAGGCFHHCCRMDLFHAMMEVRDE